MLRFKWNQIRGNSKYGPFTRFSSILCRLSGLLWCVLISEFGCHEDDNANFLWLILSEGGQMRVKESD